MREITIIDGYNLIFTQGLHTQVADLAHARERLINQLAEYTALTGKEIILVFDAYRVKEGKGETQQQDRLTVIYTGAGETADTVIARLAAHLANHRTVTVVTADWPQQRIVLGHGALRVPPRSFYQEVTTVLKASREKVPTASQPADDQLEKRLTHEVRRVLENWRRSEE